MNPRPLYVLLGQCGNMSSTFWDIFVQIASVVDVRNRSATCVFGAREPPLVFLGVQVASSEW